MDQRCFRCGRDLPLGDYAPSSRWLWGAWCLACHREYGRGVRDQRRAKANALPVVEEARAVAEQRCPRCERDLPLDNYPPSVRGKQGGYCRACGRERSRKHYERQKAKAEASGNESTARVKAEEAKVKAEAEEARVRAEAEGRAYVGSREW